MEGKLQEFSRNHPSFNFVSLVAHEFRALRLQYAIALWLMLCASEVLASIGVNVAAVGFAHEAHSDQKAESNQRHREADAIVDIPGRDH
jgi:hypothetical protein